MNMKMVMPMNNYLYLFQHILKNRMKYSLKKPVTYVYFVFIIGYAYIMLLGLGVYVDMFSLASSQGLITILTCFILFTMPSNIWTLTKKKGLIYKLSDIHFLFQMPMNPKGLLIYGYRTGLIIDLILKIVIFIGCLTLFQIPLFIALSYLIYATVFESIFEIALMICIYGNEKLSDETLKKIRLNIKALLISLLILAAYIFIFVDSSLNAFQLFIFHPLLQVIPIVGWTIAPIHLLINGFSFVSMIGTICYVIMFIATVYYAYQMPCHGQYYEDALTYANEYAEIKKRSQKGEVVFSLKKKKVRKAHITYKGYGARAIFYRQLLEYKKQRFYIFSIMTVISLCIGLLAAYFYIKNPFDQDVMVMCVLGGMSYLVLLMSGYATKWTQELESIYLYLIPDSNLKKVFYSTCVEHIRSLIDGFLVTFPIFIVGGLSLLEMIMIIFIYVSLQAVKLYLTMVVHYILGKALGKIFQQLLHMILFVMLITFGIIVYSLAFMKGLTFALLMLLIYAIVISFIFMSICTFQFDKMEKLND